MDDYAKTSNGDIRFIISQDRNIILPLIIDGMCTMPQMFDGQVIGINLYVTTPDMSRICVGTFDCVEQTVDEMNAIQQSDEEFYGVSGFDEGVLYE